MENEIIISQEDLNNEMKKEKEKNIMKINFSN